MSKSFFFLSTARPPCGPRPHSQFPSPPNFAPIPAKKGNRKKPTEGKKPPSASSFMTAPTSSSRRFRGFHNETRFHANGFVPGEKNESQTQGIYRMQMPGRIFLRHPPLPRKHPLENGPRLNEAKNVCFRKEIPNFQIPPQWLVRAERVG